MKTKFRYLILVVLFTSSIYAQTAYRIEKIENDTIITKVGAPIAEIPYFDSLPILIEKYGIENIKNAWIKGEVSIDISPLTKENKWLPLQTNQKKTIFLSKNGEKINSKIISKEPITSFSWFMFCLMLILFIFGGIFNIVLPITKNKKNKERRNVSLLLSGLIFFLSIIIGTTISIFPLVGIPIGFFIVRIVSKIVKKKKK